MRNSGLWSQGFVIFMGFFFPIKKYRIPVLSLKYEQIISTKFIYKIYSQNELMYNWKQKKKIIMGPLKVARIHLLQHRLSKLCRSSQIRYHCCRWRSHSWPLPHNHMTLFMKQTNLKPASDFHRAVDFSWLQHFHCCHSSVANRPCFHWKERRKYWRKVESQLSLEKGFQKLPDRNSREKNT